MALATAQALGSEYRVVIIAPYGPVHDEARRLGFETMVYRNPLQHLRAIRHFYARNTRVVSMNTGVVHSLASAIWERVYWSKRANLQVVHGGTDERLSYGRKKILRYFGVKQVAVSNYVKSRLVANGCAAPSITVIENFLAPERMRPPHVRAPFTAPGVRRVLIVSRLDRIKRIDLLMDAIDLDSSLREIEFRILGTGEEEQRLRQRADSGYRNIHFAGFSSTATEEMASADLFLHLCAEEPFGLAVLEAMAARLPVLVPDQGGAGSIVVAGLSGIHFRSNNARSLAEELLFFQTAGADELNRLAQGAVARLESHYSAECGERHYRELIEDCFV